MATSSASVAAMDLFKSKLITASADFQAKHKAMLDHVGPL